MTRPDDLATARPTMRRLHGEPDEMTALQRVLEGAAGHAHLATGLPPGAADAAGTVASEIVVMTRDLRSRRPAPR